VSGSATPPAATSRQAAGSQTASAPVYALEDISFAVESGQLAAIVGPSGSGKTTLSYLNPRLYDVDRGRVLIDGNDVRDLTLARWIPPANGKVETRRAAAGTPPVREFTTGQANDNAPL
jgi:ABC-type oligopeptide transport system ATPase subunit